MLMGRVRWLRNSCGTALRIGLPTVMRDALMRTDRIRENTCMGCRKTLSLVQGKFDEVWRRSASVNDIYCTDSRISRKHILEKKSGSLGCRQAEALPGLFDSFAQLWGNGAAAARGLVEIGKRLARLVGLPGGQERFSQG
jgi:hypothetical protein